VASRAQSAVQRASGLSGNRAPAYPAEARMRGEQGTVRLEIEVDEQGAVTGVRILAFERQSLARRGARAAAEGWRFHPARRDGRGAR
jgi:protein TonB